MKIVILTLLLFLTGCAYQVTAYPDQPELTAGIDNSISEVLLRVTWHNDVDSVDKACQLNKKNFVTYGCAKWVISGGISYCVVQALPPKDFNDQVRLKVLGHEVFHCFGAKHP